VGEPVPFQASLQQACHVGLRHIEWICLTPGLPLHQVDRQGDAGQGLSIHREVNGVKAGFLEFQLLDVDDEIARHEGGVVGEDDFHRDVHGGMMAGLLVHKIHGQLVRAFFRALKGDAQGDGALGCWRELGSEDVSKVPAD